MGLFDKIKGPVFLKEDSDAEQYLAQLEALKATASGDRLARIESEIRIVSAGIYGEKAIRFELENSHIPMLVLHDLYLEHNGLSAQIDYLILTRKQQFVVECKNLYGNIEINSNGDFIRSYTDGRTTKKEGIYSPITQNRRHLELIKQLRSEEKTNILSKTLFERGFYDNYRSIVVLSNPKTLLNAKYAKKEVRNQVIRADQLAEYIRRAHAEPDTVTVSEKDMMELAQYFLDAHKQNPTNYMDSFLRSLPEESASAAPTPEKIEKDAPILCPKCGAPMIKRKATKGPNVGNEFYGCSAYPKCRSIVPINK